MNYQNGKIYRLDCLVTGEVYIGSTTQPTVAKRLATHVISFKSWKKTGKGYISSFAIIERDKYSITMIEAYPCNSKDELRSREGFYIRSINCVNKVIAGRTYKEWANDNKEKIAEQCKTYFEANKEAIAEQRKEFREANKEKLAEKSKEWREANKEAIAEQKKEYYEANKEAIAKKAKEFRVANKEKLAEQRKEFREANKEQINEKQKIKRNANKDKINARKRELRKQKNNVT